MSTPDLNLSLRRLVPPLALVFYLAACGVSSSSNAGEHPARTIPDTPTQPVLASTKSQESMPSEAPSPTPTATAPVPPTIPPRPTPTPAPAYATLNDFWEGKARWVIDVFDTGLPMGESDTVYRGQGEFWTYLHASYQSAGVLDGCGDPVPFPGCITLWKSFDGGRHFELASPTCLFACDSCPCENARDHMAQQQYPRIAIQAYQHVLVYEHGAYVYLRTSEDGLNWSSKSHVPGTWIWTVPYGRCQGIDVIGQHPHVYQEFEWDCLVGGPPGVFIADEKLFVFVAMGKAPGHMGCLKGPLADGAAGLKMCDNNPLFSAELGYGPVDALGPSADPYFDFRTISSADVLRIGDRYYMTYEGVRGPSKPTVVDDQFGLGLARSTGPQIDGPWEKYPDNPIIATLPGNVGLGHGDLIIVDGVTYLYTTTSPATRGRYVLLRQES